MKPILKIVRNHYTLLAKNSYKPKNICSTAEYFYISVDLIWENYHGFCDRIATRRKIYFPLQ